MSNNNAKEIFSAVTFLILLALLLNPFGFYMPGMVGMVILAALILIFAILAGLVLKEKPRDEREAWHRMYADRVAFLVGTSLLVLAVTAQSLNHTLDPWLIYILGGMVLAKLLGLIYTQNHH